MEAWLEPLLAALALPKFGLTTIFIVTLISATLLPLVSEPAVFGFVKLNTAMFWPAVLVATAGNTIGGAITWWMGYGVEVAYERVTHKTVEHRVLGWLERFGPKACLLSFLPVVGDPLCAVAGWLRMPFWRCVGYMAVGKFARYLMMTAALLWVFPGQLKPDLLGDSDMPTPAYDQLAAAHARLHRYEHLASLAWWDRAALMPPKGNEARAAALAEIGALMHRTQTDPALGALLERAADEPLDDMQRANLREMRRGWTLATALPAELVERKTLAASRCEHAWRTQRPANDWPGFLANFRAVLACAREEASRLADRLGGSRYDALLGLYEPGMTSAELDRLFGDLRQWLPPLIASVAERQSHERVVEPAGPFARDAQRALALELMRLLGFDFAAGRLDESTHPFCGGTPEDVRMTTRYHDDDPIGTLMTAVHETGHARYEQNLPAAWLGQPLASARSMGVHESCSLAFEMQLARSRAFALLLAPRLREHLGAQPAFEPDNLHRLLTRVRRSFIRVDADEVTYPAHVILRYEIERPLIEGEIEADDIPALWDAKMAELLGLDTRGNFNHGCLQDVHWGEGAIGYFPCYTLGAMMAAQWFETMREATPDLDARIARGELHVVFDWLRDNVWRAASRYETPELLTRATGRTLDAAVFRRHLEARYA